ncbi:MAG TPA: hypothetical protein RMF84_19775, partial [Polyangiaceae bacterium LLY-WYZ-14_1]|nr:hypothetical protein [Polyangiaceae bacterium LLY-WYZ-14_1]
SLFRRACGRASAGRGGGRRGAPQARQHRVQRVRLQRPAQDLGDAGGLGTGRVHGVARDQHHRHLPQPRQPPQAPGGLQAVEAGTRGTLMGLDPDGALRLRADPPGEGMVRVTAGRVRPLPG